MTYSTTEYSVCDDCLHYLAYDDVPPEGDTDHTFYFYKVENELNGREGHFSIGIEPTEDDPEGSGYEEFSTQCCELCRSHLAGSRHGFTLFIQPTRAEELRAQRSAWLEENPGRYLEPNDPRNAGRWSMAFPDEADELSELEQEA